ncbi:MAG: hypothetical protein QNJ94_09080 [Alphaproteobacteria bacterium]|nr:hypothetical protein [Alphaproteobacteria bacterium]
MAEDAPVVRANYESARWDPIHFRPAIETATNEQCLACHQDILERRVLEQAPAGVKSSEALAWYQTLDTYSGAQDTLHRRHMVTPMAQELMNLQCNFCHQGHDPREEGPGSSATAAAVGSDAGFTLRKVVDPSQTCLRCHGAFPYEMMDLAGPWHEVRADLEPEDVKNGCQTCHEELFRTVRHRVNYLKADAIEKAAAESSDVCYGCHGGRAWYRNNFPYPRHPWPDMPEETPEWAKGRPTKSEARFLVGVEE